MGLIPRLNSGRKKEGELKIIVRVMVDVVGGGGEEEWVDGQMEGGREGGVLFAGRARKRKEKKKKERNQRKKNKKKNTVSGMIEGKQKRVFFRMWKNCRTVEASKRHSSPPPPQANKPKEKKEKKKPANCLRLASLQH